MQLGPQLPGDDGDPEGVRPEGPEGDAARHRVGAEHRVRVVMGAGEQPLPVGGVEGGETAASVDVPRPFPTALFPTAPLFATVFAAVFLATAVFFAAAFFGAAVFLAAAFFVTAFSGAVFFAAAVFAAAFFAGFGSAGVLRATAFFAALCSSAGCFGSGPLDGGRGVTGGASSARVRW